MYWRNLAGPLRAALADRPVVLLRGGRQTGKSTLARALLPDGAYLTLDDLSRLAAALDDPSGFIGGLAGPAVIDEVQRAPELLLPIKLAVDESRTPGRFLLTGSADVMLSPRVSESLAGRIEIQTLWPLSQGELTGALEGFVDALFEATAPWFEASGSRRDIVGEILTGGFPEVRALASADRREAWFGSYVTAILDRDVRDLANIESLVSLPKILRLLAARVSGLLNVSDVSRAVEIPHTTLKRYLALLQASFLVWMLPAWSASLGKRLLKSPKVYFTDTGLLGAILRLDTARVLADRAFLGPLLENFVGSELQKQAAWSRSRPSLHHFRTERGHEVDFVLEGRGGSTIGVEVKASSTLVSEDVRGLKALAEVAGDRFHRGVILYLGKHTVPFGQRFHGLPIEALWSLGSRAQSES